MHRWGLALTKQKHMMHDLLLREGLHPDQLQRFIRQKNARAEIHLCVIGLVLWHKCVDMSNSACAVALRLFGASRRISMALFQRVYTTKKNQQRSALFAPSAEGHLGCITNAPSNSLKPIAGRKR